MFRKLSGVAAGAAMLLGLASVSAEALPLAPASGLSAAPAVTLVSGGCGPFAHRNPFGECRPGGGFGGPGYGGPGYGRPRYGDEGDYGRRCFIRPTPFGPRRICR